MEVKESHVDDIAAAESLAVPQGKIAAQGCQQSLAIFGPHITTLFKLNDVMANLPVGCGDARIDGLRRPRLAGDVNPGDFPEQTFVAVVGDEVVATHA